MCKINQIIRNCLAIEAANARRNKDRFAQRAFADFIPENYIDQLLLREGDSADTEGKLSTLFSIETD